MRPCGRRPAVVAPVRLRAGTQRVKVAGITGTGSGIGDDGLAGFREAVLGGSRRRRPSDPHLTSGRVRRRSTGAGERARRIKFWQPPADTGGIVVRRPGATVSQPSGPKQPKTPRRVVGLVAIVLAVAVVGLVVASGSGSSGPARTEADRGQVARGEAAREEAARGGRTFFPFVGQGPPNKK